MLEEMKEMIAEQLNCEADTIKEETTFLWICLNW